MRAILRSIQQHPDDVATFSFQPLQPMHYLAGQWTELHLPHEPHDSRGTTRQFTLSSSPSEPELAITVRFRTSRSSFKQELQNLAIGAEVGLDEPMGDFVLPLNQKTPLIWIAGGIGITPFRSMAKWLSDTQESRDITLFHSSSDSSDELFTGIFQSAGITDQHIFRQGQSMGTRLAAADVVAATSAKPGALYFVSGPEPMVEAFRKDLATQGIAPFNIVTDAFLGYR